MVTGMAGGDPITGIGDATGNARLRGLLGESGLSNSALARSVVAAGAAENVHVGTTATSVRRMLDGSQPHWPVPRLVAAVLSRKLGREVSVAECGFTSPTVAAAEQVDGLRCAGTLVGTVRTVVSLSGQDLNRRRLLKGSALAVTGFAQPALFALTLPAEANVARQSGRRVGAADIEVLIEQLTHLRRLDHRFGAGRVREQVVGLVNRAANLALHGSYTDATGRALLEAVAHGTWLAGLMACDLGRHALAQRYYTQSLNVAVCAGSRAYAANVLSHMSRLTLQLGQTPQRGQAGTADDRALNARQAIALARTGLTLAEGSATPAVKALLHAVEARGLSQLRDTSAARTALRSAEAYYARHRDGEEPTWIGFYTQAELDADLGRALNDLGDTGPAVRSLTGALDGYEAWRTRSRCFVNTDLAATHLNAGQAEQALTAARAAITAAAPVDSVRTRERLRTLHAAAGLAAPRSRYVRDLHEELARFLTEQTHR
jgi:tetratricopeptide (TPR) repeat protein